MLDASNVLFGINTFSKVCRKTDNSPGGVDVEALEFNGEHWLAEMFSFDGANPAKSSLLGSVDPADPMLPISEVLLVLGDGVGSPLLTCGAPFFLWIHLPRLRIRLM